MMDKIINYTNGYNRRNMDTAMVDVYLSQVSQGEKGKNMRYFDTPQDSLTNIKIRKRTYIRESRQKKR